MTPRHPARLSETDAAALDVLLDQSVSGGVTRGPALSAREMAGVSQTLELLSQLPPVESPVGLADRVLRAVDAIRPGSFLSGFCELPTSLHA